MKRMEAISPSKIAAILERLHPSSLLLVNNGSGLPEETLEPLWRKLTASFDPQLRLAAIEYLLLLMCQARQKDAQDYLHRVFLPWHELKRRLEKQVHRILDDVAHLEQLEADTEDDAAHIATKIYRPLIADVFDPYLTLLTATYAFLDGNFVSIDASNLGASERTKAEIVTARIRRFGGPAELLWGYDPLVRNALSHAGSDGVLYESEGVLFRNVKRGTPPVVEARRWSHEELNRRVVALMELVMSIDAACDVFGIDCIDILSSGETAARVMHHVLDRSQRHALQEEMTDRFARIREAENLTPDDRLNVLTKLLFIEFQKREIPCNGLGFNIEKKACFVEVPIETIPSTDQDIRTRVAYLIRYAILARVIFGGLFDTFVVEGHVTEREPIRVTLSGDPLDEYAADNAGLIDLMADAEVLLEGEPIEITIDKVALTAIEDVALEPRMPRRGRPRN